MSKTNKGFTLIELLVVIAIIGILSSVVLASLNNAREKARDARRISDIKNVQLALELHADDNNGNYADALVDLVPNYISAVPVDPLDDSAYPFASDGGTEYHIAADLEGPASSLPGNDAGCDSATPDACFTEALTGGFDGDTPAAGRHVRYDQKD